MIDLKEKINVNIDAIQPLSGNINVAARSYELPIASENELGAIKVGENLTIEEDGTLNAIAGSNGGNIGNFIYAYNGEKITIKPDGYAVLSLDTMITDTTNGALILENGAVKIGKGVSAILVLMNMTTWNNASKYLYLQKNGTNIGVKSTKSDINLVDMVCYTDVKEGDIIRGVIWNKSNSTIDVDSYVVNTYTKIIIMK